MLNRPQAIAAQRQCPAYSASIRHSVDRVCTPPIQRIAFLIRGECGKAVEIAVTPPAQQESLGA